MRQPCVWQPVCDVTRAERRPRVEGPLQASCCGKAGAAICGRARAHGPLCCVMGAAGRFLVSAAAVVPLPTHKDSPP